MEQHDTVKARLHIYMFLQMFMEACHNILVTIQSAVKTKGGADCNAKVFQNKLNVQCRSLWVKRPTS